jgi:hypothetical protein
MSRIGKAPINLPSGVDVAVSGRTITVKGPKGTLSRAIPGEIVVRQEDSTLLTCTRPNDERRNRAQHGLTRSLVNNMVLGVTEGFKKNLEIIGVGYRAEAQGPSAAAASTSASATRSTSPRQMASRSRCRCRPRSSSTASTRGRRPGRRRHPQYPQARAVQGQGRQVRRRARPAQGRQSRQK